MFPCNYPGRWSQLFIIQNPNDPQAAQKFQEMAAASVPSLVSSHSPDGHAYILVTRSSVIQRAEHYTTKAGWLV